jgi:hypothetical protein
LNPSRLHARKITLSTNLDERKQRSKQETSPGERRRSGLQHCRKIVILHGGRVSKGSGKMEEIPPNEKVDRNHDQSTD